MPLARNYFPPVFYGSKWLPSDILGGGTLFTGNVFYVKPYDGDDTAAGNTPATAFKTLRHALTACTANNNDVVYLIAESNTAASTSDLLTANLDWNVAGTHLIGINCGTQFSQRSRIANNTATASFANLFTISATNCLIANVAFVQEAGSDTLSAAQTCVTVSGMRNTFVNCQMAGNSASTTEYAGTNSLTISSAENLFVHCLFGNDTILRANATFETTIGGAGTRNTFEDCTWLSWVASANTTFKAITFTNASAHTLTTFKNCIFAAEQGGTGYGTPTGAIAVGSISRPILILGGCCYGYLEYVTGGSALAQISAVVSTTESGETVNVAT